MRSIFCLFALLLSHALYAQVTVPAPLEPWRGWAQDGEEFRDCALIAGHQGEAAQDFVCAWPGVLQIAADANGAKFAMSWQVQAESWVPLPGDGDNWPQDVLVNGQSVPVVKHDNAPQILLKPGNYALSGRIGWTHRPQSLAVPSAIGLVHLQVDGQPIAPVQFDDGELVLGRGTSEAPEADALDLRVYRRLRDDVPMMLDTDIQIGAAGQAREEVIGPVLPPGFVPTSIAVDAGWPAKIEADGRLRIQVQPDVTHIHILARALKPLASTSIGTIAKPWPAQEIWSYAGTPEQRVTSASGPPQVDPKQAQVPNEWRNLPAFALSPGVALNIQIRSRGLGSNESNRLSLNREAWLDFSGAGWTVRDGITGNMHQGWRLDAKAPYRLEDARDLTADQALLITQGDDNATGVEWRTPIVNMSAGLRVQPATYALPVGGWRQTFDAVNTTLHLPPGYRLIAAPGADTASGSWVSQWTLLDIFLVAIVVLFAWRALGLTGAALALVYLLIDCHEFGAPLYSLGIVLAIALLLRALPDGRLRNVGDWARKGACVVLALLMVPFAAMQLRMALYPQLEASIAQTENDNGLLEGRIVAPEGNARTQAGKYDFYTSPASAAAQDRDEAMAASTAPPPPVVMDQPTPMSAPMPMPMKAMPPPPRQMPVMSAQVMGGQSAGDAVVMEKAKNLDSVTVTGSRIRRADMMDRYSQTTVVQAGRGLPNWSGGQSYRLSWGGPVTVGQSVRLLISPPWLTRLLRVLAVLALAWLLLRSSGARLRSLPLPKTPAIASLLLLSAIVAGHSSPAQAQSSPTNEVLQELHDRLARAPKCAPDCAAIADAHVDARDAQLQVTLDVHAGTSVGVPMPMDAKSLSLDSVQVDGKVVPGMLRNDDGLSLPLERGVHRVLLTYRITGDRVALAFPMKPYAIAFSGDVWQATGITDARLLTETLSLNRLHKQGNGNDSAVPAQEFPPYVRVERTVSLGLDWTAHTIVHRIAPKVGGFSVKLPVIAGEKVITPGLLVHQDGLEIPMPDGKDNAIWDATLDKSGALTLRAPDLADHAEVWRVRVSPMWRAKFSGVPESVPQQDADANDWHEFVFHPLPGESLRIAVTRPEPVAGSTQAIESVKLHSTIGQRASEYTLGLRLRASQGGERVIGLPENAELIAVTRNGESLNLRLESGKLSLPVQPGEQAYEVHFRDGVSIGLHNSTPTVALGLSAANVDLGLSLPQDRWVLLTHGPQSGPAVLYWGELLVLLLIAFGLSRLHWTPLELRDWLLLGMGFSTFSWIAPAVVVAWLFALAWRERHGAALPGKYRFAGVQIALVGLSIAAILALITAVPFGLLGQPDMHIVNPTDGDGVLHWFADQSGDALPSAGVVSVPLWLYRTAMLAWALWLANAVLGWLRWGLRAWLAGGYWRPLRKAKAIAVVVQVPAEPTGGEEVAPE